MAAFSKLFLYKSIDVDFFGFAVMGKVATDSTDMHLPIPTMEITVAVIHTVQPEEYKQELQCVLPRPCSPSTWTPKEGRPGSVNAISRLTAQLFKKWKLPGRFRGCYRAALLVARRGISQSKEVGNKQNRM